jgi:predicted transcriptional regulator
MKTNITLKLDGDLLRKAKILAAEQDTSVSALLAQQLEKIVREREGYEQAKRRALARLKRGYNLGYKPPKSRDEFYER